MTFLTDARLALRTSTRTLVERHDRESRVLSVGGGATNVLARLAASGCGA